MHQVEKIGPVEFEGDVITIQLQQVSGTAFNVDSKRIAGFFKDETAVRGYALVSRLDPKQPRSYKAALLRSRDSRDKLKVAG